jgi:oxygen-independent coproporphyrinogen III oxidase
MKILESLYIHFPFCRHLCNYCDFFKQVSTGESRPHDIAGFEKELTKSFDEHYNFLSKNSYSLSKLKTLYIGGGTPSLWGSNGPHFLKEIFQKYNLSFDPSYEFTLEVNPGSWTEDDLSEWVSFGVNRFSLGIQSTDATFLKLLDRIHNVDDVFHTLDFFNRFNMNFSVDLMLGLHESEKYKRNIKRELLDLLKYSPNHFSVYILTVKDNYTHYKNLPSEEWIEREYLEVSNLLKNHGYNHYEVSNFALEESESKHNLSYWKSNSVGAVGPSATGLLAEDKIRYKWKTKDQIFDTEKLTDEEFNLESFYMRLRTNLGINKDFFIDNNVLDLLDLWSSKGLITESLGVIYTSSRGFLLLDSMMDELFLRNVSFNINWLES